MAQEWNHDVYKWLLAAVLAGTAWSPAWTGHAAGENGLSQGNLSESKGAIVTFNDLSQLPVNQVQGINEAVQRGILSGYPDGSFKPQMNMTRMEFAVILAKALQLSPVEDSASFSDVSSNWASGYIEAVKRAGLMNGDADGKFYPNEVINREQLATIFVRAIGATDIKSDPMLTSAAQPETSTWANAAVKTALTLGLLPAGDDRFRSTEPVHRGDVAQLMMNLLQSEQRSASITAVHGDLVTVDGKTYMIGKQLKSLFKTDNLNALIGSDITFESLNHSLANLTAIDLKASGTEQASLVFDAGTAFSGDLTLSGDHLSVRGSELNGVQVQQGVTRLDLQANTKQLIINTDQRLQITGTSQVGQIQVTSPNARVQMDERIVPAGVTLPTGVTDREIIFGNANSSAIPTIGGSSITPSNNINTNKDDKDKKSNHAPVVTHPLSDRSVTLGDDETMIELDGLFQDEDGDELTYAAVSSDVYVADASIRHSRLVVHPNAIGQTRIAVTAQDAKSKAAETSFTYTVSAATYEEQPNHNPLVLTTPNDLNLLAGALSDPILLANLFSDPDGDSLRYTYTIDDTSIVSALQTGNELVLSAQNAGTATVTINASDHRGGSTYVQFHVQVQPVIQLNRKPIIIRQMDNVTLTATPDVYSIKLSELFSDPDGDPLVYDALLTMPYMQSTLVGDKLDLMPLQAGELNVILRAIDSHGAYASQMFTIKLTVPTFNHAPYIKKTLAPFSIGLLDQPYTVDLATLFGDNDNDVLTYTATSSDTNVMQTSLNGSILTATPVGAGSTTLNLKVNDGQGGTNAQNVNVSVVKNGPFISEMVWKDSNNQAIELYNPTNASLRYSDLYLKISDSNSTIDQMFILNDSQAVVQTKATLVIQENNGLDLMSQGESYYGDLGLGNTSGPVTVKLYYKNQLMDIATFSTDQTLRRDQRTVGNPISFNSSEWMITSGADDSNLGVYGMAKP
ncbi:S-layer homology domain-containing protein [Paenibacillus wenxiniae]|uniref:S-layer homology domain-containing protein n=1 Tax=Paenibacillus wenxiniae TaxID=1636843 RepID=A0ABW4RF51_9BACL